MKAAFLFSMLLLLPPLGGCGGNDGGIGVFSSRPEEFRDYRSWRIIDYTIGQSNPLLGGAHRGSDERWMRRMYLYVPSPLDGSRYPVGTIVVKETYTWENGVRRFDTDGVSAMVKRGGSNNPDGGGWEWIVLTPDLRKITSRGGPDMGMCNSCHANAESQENGGDFVFAFPTEFAMREDEFDRYQSWSRIGEGSGPVEHLGYAHGAGDPAATRTVFKRQLLANPDLDSLGYPVGTALAIEVRRGGDVTNLQAMVKRGGDFNPRNQGWEWFILDADTRRPLYRGDNPGDGACNACHRAAAERGTGRDYVFRHPGDPFNQ